MTTDSSRLWAKSKPYGKDVHSSMYLHTHLADVHSSAAKVLDATATDQLVALGIVGSEARTRLTRCVLLAAAIHDLGKANDHFQGMIRGERDVRQNPQGLRHEWITVLMLRQLKEWLLPAVGGADVDFAIVEWAVAGHHPGPHHPSPPKESPPGSGAEIRLLCGFTDFRYVLTWLADTFENLSTPPTIETIQRNLVGTNSVFTEITVWAKTAKRTWDRMTPTDRGFVAAVKNTLIAADVAGSALPKAMPFDTNRWNWITKSFDERPEHGDLQAVVDHRLKGNAPRDFQLNVARSSLRTTYVKAGCGCGKTLAAYMWAAQNYPTRRMYFCYPTTGTATEGFKDYLFAPEVDSVEDTPDADRIRQLGAKLFHSRRDVDFEIILGTGEDTLASEHDAVARLDSLEAWSTPVVACTVDSVLGLVQNNKRGLFAWPALAQSAFVFDEIHAFDDRLFGALLRFLRDLPGLPVLLMTASLPKLREAALRETLEKRGSDLAPIPGPTVLEELPRYRKAILPENDPLPLVKETLANSGKVLWVGNTVKRVMEAADRTNGLNSLIYHSRFKYEHRVQRHKDVIDAFNPKKNAGAALAICSQVAEMSLDLSADLLVTDLATVPALIQRLGRLNRRSTPENPIPPKPFVIVEPDNHLPYTPADLEAARQWYGRLSASEISQRHLADAWEQSAEQLPDLIPSLIPSAWLDGGPTTTVVELRESSPGITVLMDEDLIRVEERPKDTGRLVLPMPPPPRALSWRQWRKYRGWLPIAPQGTIAYDPKRGAEWLK
jgi:CRISPR-associated endonuclease/helicase Cas3